MRCDLVKSFDRCKFVMAEVEFAEVGQKESVRRQFFQAVAGERYRLKTRKVVETSDVVDVVVVCSQFLQYRAASESRYERSEFVGGDVEFDEACQGG